MDPTANLDEQRGIRAVLECLEDEESRAPHLERLADLAEALDDWLAGGGSLPEQWSAARLMLALETAYRARRARSGGHIPNMPYQDAQADLWRACAVLWGKGSPQ